MFSSNCVLFWQGEKAFLSFLPSGDATDITNSSQWLECSYLKRRLSRTRLNLRQPRRILINLDFRETWPPAVLAMFDFLPWVRSIYTASKNSSHLPNFWAQPCFKKCQYCKIESHAISIIFWVWRIFVGSVCLSHLLRLVVQAKFPLPLQIYSSS